MFRLQMKSLLPEKNSGGDSAISSTGLIPVLLALQIGHGALWAEAPGALLEIDARLHVADSNVMSQLGVQLILSAPSLQQKEIPARCARPGRRMGKPYRAVDQHLPVYRIQQRTAAPDNALIVSAGEQVTLTEDENGVTASRPAGADGSKSSLEGRPAPLRFTGEPLTQVIATVNRYTTDRLVIADEGIRNLKIVGSFEPMPFSGLLAYLKTRYGIVAIPLGVDDHDRRVIALARVSVRQGEGVPTRNDIAR